MLTLFKEINEQSLKSIFKLKYHTEIIDVEGIKVKCRSYFTRTSYKKKVGPSIETEYKIVNFNGVDILLIYFTTTLYNKVTKILKPTTQEVECYISFRIQPEPVNLLEYVDNKYKVFNVKTCPLPKVIKEDKKFQAVWHAN